MAGDYRGIVRSMNDDWNGDDDGHVDSSQCGLVCDNHPDRQIEQLSAGDVATWVTGDYTGIASNCCQLLPRCAF